MKLKKHVLIASAMLLCMQGFAPAVWEAGGNIAHAGTYDMAAPSGTSQTPAKPITGLTVSKARYAPGEKAVLTLHFDKSTRWSGKLKLQIFQANTLTAEGTKAITVLPEQENDLTVEWLPPSVDFRGYLVKAWVEGSAPDSYVTAAIDVSSEWTHFPRYGYIGEFPQETVEESDAKLRQLSQDYYINAYQFYDWMWRHDVSVYSKTDAEGNPLRDGHGNFITETIDPSAKYTDLLGRTLYPLTVMQEIAAAQKYGSAAMAYQMNYAARENYQQFGVKPEWGLYHKNAPIPPQPYKDQEGFFFDGVKPKPTGLYLQDPGNPEWRSYITKEYNRAVNEFGFNGIHLDQWGAADNDYLMSYQGEKRFYSLDYDKIINDTKHSLLANNPDKSDVAFNMVGGNAGYSAVTKPETQTDFHYSEIWQNMDNYRDLQKVIYDTRNKDDKAMVIAGYMNYKQATGIPYSGSEAKDVPETLIFQSRINSSPSWVGDFGKKDEDQVIFTVHVPAAGTYDLTLRYGHGNSGGSPDGKLSVNGAVAVPSMTFDQNTGWGNPVAAKKVTVSLQQGENKIKLQLNSNDLWLNLQQLDVAGPSFTKSYQAVFAELISCKVDHYGSVYYFETDGDYVQFEADAPEEGDYSLAFGYGVLNNPVERALYINNVKAEPSVTFGSTGGWSNFEESTVRQVHLAKGKNIISLRADGVNDTGLSLQYLKAAGEIYMAEKADFGWAPTKQAAIQKIMGNASDDAAAIGYISDFKQQGDYVTTSIGSVQQSGNYDVTVTYKNQETAPVKRVLYVDGRKAGTLTFPAGEGWNTVSLPVYIPSANETNVIKLKQEDESENAGIWIDKIEVNGLTLQAETADTGWEPVVPRKGSISAIPAKTDDFGIKGQSVTFRIDLENAAEQLDFTYRSGNNPVLSVEVDGQLAAKDVQFAATPGGWDGGMAAKTVKTSLQPGKHTVKLTMESEGQYINLSTLIAGNDEYGIENAVLGAAPTGQTISAKTGYADDFKDDGDFIIFDANVPAAGLYDLAWNYASDSVQTVQRSVYVNNGAGQTVTFATYGGSVWTGAPMNGVPLNKGLNSITIRVYGADDDGIKLDHLKISSQDQAYSKIYEAEKANFLPPMELYKDTVVHFGHIGDQVSFDVEVPQSGEASIIYTYSNAGATTYRSVYVDGQRSLNIEGRPGKATFDGTGADSFSEDGYFIIPNLTKGTHRITLKMEEDSGKGSISIRGATLGYFNEPSLRLMDAGLAALGATHIEIGTAEKLENGPNLLAHEYFPNRSKKMLDTTKETLREYYKFYAAYENLLFDSRESADTLIDVSINGKPAALSTDGSKNTLWYIPRKNVSNTGFERYDILHLINLLDNDENWRNSANAAVMQNNLKVTYPIGLTKEQAPRLKVYAATPDSGHGMFKELAYTWSGTNLVIDLPALSYWSMIFIDRDPQKSTVQNLFPAETGSNPPPADNPAPAGSGQGLVAAAGAPTAQIVKEDELKRVESGQVTIEWDNKGKGSLLLPAGAHEILGNNLLIVKTKDFSLTIDPAVLKQLVEANKGNLDGSSQIRLSVNPLNDADSAGVQKDAALKPVGSVVSFELGISTKDGKFASLQTFDKPVEWVLHVQASPEQAELLGVYYWNENLKSWEYIGGTIDLAGQTIRVSLPHFSIYAVFVYDKAFTDVPPEHWAYQAVRSLAAKHIGTGTTDTAFDPDAPITRAQFAALLTRALGLKTAASAPFTDVSEAEWYASDVAAAYEAGIVNGRSDEAFAPDETVSREEMAAMLLRAYELRRGPQPAAPEGHFADADSISEWAKAIVDQAAVLGIVAGDGEGKFSPLNNTSRAETAQALSNLLKLLQ